MCDKSAVRCGDKKEKVIHQSRALEYYATPGILTQVGEYAPLFDALPREIPELCMAVQGLLVNIMHVRKLNPQLPEERLCEIQLRPVEQKIRCILELDPRPLTEPRPVEKRLVSNCRDNTLMLVAALRHKGIPARARTGGGTYFQSGKLIDHCMCEYWDAKRQEWVMVEPNRCPRNKENSERFRHDCDKSFDTCDVPAVKYLTASMAWLLCRADGVDPEKFMIFSLHGMNLVKDCLIRDLANLNKVELLKWDFWGLMEKPMTELTLDNLALLDQVAALGAIPGTIAFDKLRTLYLNSPKLCVPETVQSFPNLWYSDDEEERKKSVLYSLTNIMDAF